MNSRSSVLDKDPCMVALWVTEVIYLCWWILLLSDGLTAKVRTSGDHAAGTGRRKLGLARVQGPNTGIIAEVAVRAGERSSNLNYHHILFELSIFELLSCMYTILLVINSMLIDFNFCNFFWVVPSGSERKGVRKCAERVEAGLLIHLPSGAETQLWMHKRPWPEGKATVYGAFTI